MEQFAQLLCDDLELYSNTFVPAIAASMRQQLEQYTADVIPEDEEDRRVIIKVLHVHTLQNFLNLCIIIVK